MDLQSLSVAEVIDVPVHKNRPIHHNEKICMGIPYLNINKSSDNNEKRIAMKNRETKTNATTRTRNDDHSPTTTSSSSASSSDSDESYPSSVTSSSHTTEYIGYCPEKVFSKENLATLCEVRRLGETYKDKTGFEYAYVTTSSALRMKVRGEYKRFRTAEEARTLMGLSEASKVNN